MQRAPGFYLDIRSVKSDFFFAIPWLFHGMIFILEMLRSWIYGWRLIGILFQICWSFIFLLVSLLRCNQLGTSLFLDPCCLQTYIPFTRSLFWILSMICKSSLGFFRSGPHSVDLTLRIRLGPYHIWTLIAVGSFPVRFGIEYYAKIFFRFRLFISNVAELKFYWRRDW